MKLLIVLLAVLAGVLLWQRGRRLKNQSRQDESPRTNAPAVLQSMLRCARCGVHLPAADAVVGRQGSYCSVNHRHEAEGS